MTPAARPAADLGALRIEQRDDREALLPESGVVRQREAEVACPENGDVDAAIQAEDRPQVSLQLLDVVPDAADAEGWAVLAREATFPALLKPRQGARQGAFAEWDME